MHLMNVVDGEDTESLCIWYALMIPKMKIMPRV